MGARVTRRAPTVTTLRSLTGRARWIVREIETVIERALIRSTPDHAALANGEARDHAAVVDLPVGMDPGRNGSDPGYAMPTTRLAALR